MSQVLKESGKLNPHKRPKEPEKVRKLILQTAEKLASEGGEDLVSFAKALLATDPSQRATPVSLFDHPFLQEI